MMTWPAFSAILLVGEYLPQALAWPAFSAILLVGEYLPQALPLYLRPALLPDNDARLPARAAKCAILVAISGLMLLRVSMQQQGACGPAGVAMMMEAAWVLWLNLASLFLGWLLEFVVVALHPARVPLFILQVAIGGLVLLPAARAGVAMATMMEARVLLFSSAALFLGWLRGVLVVAPHLPARVPPFILQVAIDDLTLVTETVAITAFAHNLCIFFKIFKL